jgi:hypothetical protein
VDDINDVKKPLNEEQELLAMAKFIVAHHRAECDVIGIDHSTTRDMVILFSACFVAGYYVCAYCNAWTVSDLSRMEPPHIPKCPHCGDKCQPLAWGDAFQRVIQDKLGASNDKLRTQEGQGELLAAMYGFIDSVVMDSMKVKFNFEFKPNIKSS